MKDINPESPRKEKVITLNKKAHYEYHIFERYDAGIELFGTEVKSLRQQKASIQEAYARVKNREIWLINSNIPVYSFGSNANHEPQRDRKLLLHRSEIKKIITKLQEKGFTLIPLKLYFSGAYIKAELGLAKGKKLFDKRETIKKADVQKRLKKLKQSY